ncbi:ABC transporter ATP-binding protein [Lachnospiraceae bacterium]|uniref:energy-coupling factor ABC transporter ATP-binding protein n=1 Tax=Extibacter sp. GGCC_0201 TaxID=2731209 RepID=UPI001AA0D7DF|nr:ABC transporter ATP-binding protein [Extibacter sp. GGCC_0201]MBO1721099.1 ABC transporter ATP-binding protein [Extibacter sp. GGCC_0201]BDF35461.1 ABC transporter ATP-binding protein [Lachnospiraceae bacterium]BDF39463.1 ABC transporter ATP-binding protein [Lachnospiraceae bacterium]
MAYIELNEVTYTYPLMKEPALQNISCSLELGKFYGVIGENAGGKTTFCNLLRGLIPHFYNGKLLGDMKINGEDIRKIDVDVLSTKMGYIFQNPFTQISGVRKTVFEEIALGLENLGVPKAQMIEKVIEVAKLLKIEELLLNDPNRLSGGQRQRVAFASIIAMDSDIFVIDEPTSQLDPEGTERIFEIIHMLKEQGKTIILVEHKVDLIAEYADEVLVFQKGRLLKKGDARTVLSDLELLEHGTMLPQAIILERELRLNGIVLPKVPVTTEECIDLLQKGGVRYEPN